MEPDNKSKFPLNAKVRFAEDRLAVLMPQDRKRLEGRIGVVQSYSNHARKPTVYFPEQDDRPELRLFSVDPRHIELTDDPPPEPEIEQKVIEESGDGEKMSQDDLDKLFG